MLFQSRFNLLPPGDVDAFADQAIGCQLLLHQLPVMRMVFQVKNAQRSLDRHGFHNSGIRTPTPRTNSLDGARGWRWRPSLANDFFDPCALAGLRSSKKRLLPGTAGQQPLFLPLASARPIRWKFSAAGPGFGRPIVPMRMCSSHRGQASLKVQSNGTMFIRMKKR